MFIINLRSIEFKKVKFYKVLDNAPTNQTFLHLLNLIVFKIFKY